MRVRAWAKLHAGRVSYRRVRSEPHTLHVLFGAVEHVLRQLAARVGLLEVHLKVHVQRERVDVLELERPEQRPSAVARPVRRKVVVLDEGVDQTVGVASGGGLPDGGQSGRVLTRLLREHARQHGKESESAHWTRHASPSWVQKADTLDIRVVHAVDVMCMCTRMRMWSCGLLGLHTHGTCAHACFHAFT